MYSNLSLVRTNPSMLETECDNISYHTRASGIRKNTALLRHISNEGRIRAIFFRIPRARVFLRIYLPVSCTSMRKVSNFRTFCCNQAHKVQNVIFALSVYCVIKTEEVGHKTEEVEYAFIPLVVRASDQWISAYLKIISHTYSNFFLLN